MTSDIVFGQPFEVTFKFTNNGPEDAIWNGDSSQSGNNPFEFNHMRSPFSGGSGRLVMENQQLNCQAEGGATCPLINNSFPPSQEIGIGGSHNQFEEQGINNAYSIPAGGALVYTYSYIPTSYSGECPNGEMLLPIVNLRNNRTTLEGAYDPNPINNSVQRASQNAPKCMNLTVNKQLFVDETASNVVDVGGELSFHLTATAPPVEQMGEDVPGVLMSDVLPEGFLFDPGTPGQFTCTKVPVSDTQTQCATLGNGIEWNPATRLLEIHTPLVQAGTAITYALHGRAINESGVWTNRVDLSLTNPGFVDTIVGNNLSIVEFTINGRQPIVMKSTSTPVLTAAGDDVSYNLSISNPSNGDAIINGVLSDTLPNGFILKSASAPVLSGAGAVYSEAQTPQPGATTLEWGDFTLPAGTSISVDIVVRSNPALSCGSDVIHNSAQFDYFVGMNAHHAAYDGAAAGHTREDVTFPCVPVTTGQLEASMVINGAPAGYTATAGVFATCTDASSVQTRYPTSGALPLSQAVSALQSSIAAGSSCTVEVDSSSPISAPPTGYQWASTTPTVTPTNVVTVEAGLTSNLQFEWTLEPSPPVQTTGDLTVDFVITGGPSGIVSTVPVFAICDLPTTGTRYPSSGSAVVSTQTPVVLTAIPTGAQCTLSVDESQLPEAPTGYEWTSASPTTSTLDVMTDDGITGTVQWTLRVKPTDGGGNPPNVAVPVPVGHPLMLALLSLMLGYAALRSRKRFF